MKLNNESIWPGAMRYVKIKKWSGNLFYYLKGVAKFMAHYIVEQGIYAGGEKVQDTGELVEYRVDFQLVNVVG